MRRRANESPQSISLPTKKRSAWGSMVPPFRTREPDVFLFLLWLFFRVIIPFFLCFFFWCWFLNPASTQASTLVCQLTAVHCAILPGLQHTGGQKPGSPRHAPSKSCEQNDRWQWLGTIVYTVSLYIGYIPRYIPFFHEYPMCAGTPNFAAACDSHAEGSWIDHSCTELSQWFATRKRWLMGGPQLCSEQETTLAHYVKPMAATSAPSNTQLQRPVRASRQVRSSAMNYCAQRCAQCALGVYMVHVHDRVCSQDAFAISLLFCSQRCQGPDSSSFWCAWVSSAACKGTYMIDWVGLISRGAKSPNIA